jgi:hypothetical protein
LAFAHNSFVRLVAAPYSIFKLAITLRQFLDDDVRASREVALKRGIEKNGLANVKSVIRHGSPGARKRTAVILNYRGG